MSMSIDDALMKRESNVKTIMDAMGKKNAMIIDLRKELERTKHERNALIDTHLTDIEKLHRSYQTTVAEYEKKILSLRNVRDVNKTLYRQLANVQCHLSFAEKENAQLTNQLLKLQSPEHAVWTEIYHISEREEGIVMHYIEFERMQRKLKKYQQLDRERQEQVKDLVAQLQKTTRQMDELDAINMSRLQTNISLQNRLRFAEKWASCVPDRDSRIRDLTREIITARLLVDKTEAKMKNEQSKHQIYIDEMERQYNIFLKEIEREATDTYRVEILEETINQLKEQHLTEKKNIFAQLKIASEINGEKLAERDAQITKLSTTIATYSAMFKDAMKKPDLTQSASK